MSCTCLGVARALLALTFAALVSGKPRLPHKCPPTVFDSQVDEYLKPFAKSGVLRGRLDQAEKHVQGSWAFRVKILNGVLHYKSLTPPGYRKSKFYFPLAVLQVTACKYYLPDIDLVLQMEDYGVVDMFANDTILPIFSYTKNAATGADILFPNPFPFLHGQQRAFSNLAKLPEWSKRLPKAVFRGSTTGFYNTTLTNWHTSSRGKLVSQCSKIKDVCDGGFTQVVQSSQPAQVWAAVKKAGCSAEALPMDQWVNYKYILMADGNGPSASRFTKLLMSTSAVVKQSSPAVEFFYTQIKPYEHYIPLSAESLDLNQTIRWAIDNDKAAYKIGQNARAFASKHLHVDVVHCFFSKLLKKYASLQTFFPRVTDNESEFVPWFDELEPNFQSNFRAATRGKCPPLDQSGHTEVD